MTGEALMTEVTQADRDLYVRICPDMCSLILNGDLDGFEQMQAIARHRLASSASVDGGGEAKDRVLIWSGEHHAYWRPNSAGYCTDGFGAGIYSRADAERIAAGCDAEKRVSIREIDPTWPIVAALRAPEYTAIKPDAVSDAEAWQPIRTYRRDGTPFIGRARNSAGQWMYPWLYRHEGKIYSQFQEHLNGEWRNCDSPPTFWLPASITDPSTTPTADAGSDASSGGQEYTVDALAAGQSVAQLLADVLLTLQHARTFIVSREKMHPDGVSLYDADVAKVEASVACFKREKFHG